MRSADLLVKCSTDVESMWTLRSMPGSNEISPGIFWEGIAGNRVSVNGMAPS